jgi:acyl transferase domain-containing protein
MDRNAGGFAISAKVGPPRRQEPAAHQPAFVFGPLVEGCAGPALAAALGHEGGAALNEWCERAADPELAAAIARYVDTGRIQRPWLQSAVTAVQIALATALGRLGLAPAAVAGLSMGELAAGVVAGRLDIGDATRVARGISSLFAVSSGDGRMAVVATNRTTLALALGADGPALAITLEPHMQVIAGHRGDIDRVSRALQASGIAVHELRLPTAFHSTFVEALCESFLDQLGPITPRHGRARLYSGIDASSSPPLTAAYWWNMCRQSFHFDDAIRAMLADGFRWFIEFGPRSVVTRYIVAIAGDLGLQVRVDSARALLIEAARTEAAEPIRFAERPAITSAGWGD